MDESDLPDAVIRIDRPGAMTQNAREDVAEWLRRTADCLVEDEMIDHMQTGTFRAHYFRR